MYTNTGKSSLSVHGSGGSYVILKTNYLKPFAFHFGIFNKI